MMAGMASAFTKLTIRPLNAEDARAIASWGYEPPYSFYNLSQEEIPGLLHPGNRYFTVQDESGRLIGYCTYGTEAQVPGGEYHLAEPVVLDVGIGMHPGMVGRGLGKAFVAAILQFAVEAFKPDRFRVSIAGFNQRSQRTFLNLGFHQTHSFSRQGDGMAFIQLEREVQRSG